MDKEFFKLFFQQDKEFFSNEDYITLSKIEENEQFLNELLYIFENKTIPSEINFGLYENGFDINITQLFLKRNIKKNNKENIEYYLLLYNELYKQLNYTAVSSLSKGQYLSFLKLIKKYLKYEDYDMELLSEFYKNLPEPKLVLLCDYMFYTYYEKENNINDKVYLLYKNMSKENIKKYLKRSNVYKLMSNDSFDFILENYYAYYEISVLIASPALTN